MIDISRLLVQLNNTGLQNKDTPLYQFLKQLLGTVKNVNDSVTNVSSSSSVVNNIINQSAIIFDDYREDNILPLSSPILGQALTEVDDTNVTLTLGGSPSNALINATSLTLGWVGTLAAGRLNSN